MTRRKPSEPLPLEAVDLIDRTALRAAVQKVADDYGACDAVLVIQNRIDSAAPIRAEAGTLPRSYWMEFLAWEEEAARQGSGMTSEQKAGAAMYRGWLVNLAPDDGRAETGTLDVCAYAGRNRGWCIRHDDEWRIDSDVCEFLLLCVGSEFPHDTLDDKRGCPDCAAEYARLAGADRE